MKQEELDQLEVSNNMAKIAIAKGEALKRLLDNPDYKLVISNGYFKELPEEIAVAIANNTGGYDTDKLIEMLTQINGLKMYEFKVASNHSAALQTLEDNAEYVAEGGSYE